MSRLLTDLEPVTQALAADFMVKCHEAGLDVLVTCTYRTDDDQTALYAQGRTAPGKIVTRAQAGQSAHNHRMAIDIVPLQYGKPVWVSTSPLWSQVGAIGMACGLEWAGMWTTFREYPHLQRPNWRTFVEGVN